ncbi:MAG: hypothetical protein K9N51_03025 [Candidatus Pacebacteria bacterium]|nr:hypothetical protein [Candidatus Paceibacterota bacterium]
MRHTIQQKQLGKLRDIVVLTVAVLGVTLRMEVRASELWGGEAHITPRVTAGFVSWDELRNRGGHKSLGGVGLNLDYLVHDVGVSLDLWKWWVSEGLDSSEGVMPEDGHRIGLEARRMFSVDERVKWFPYVGVAYEEWKRDRVLGKWSTVDFWSAAIGVGLQLEAGHFLKAGITQCFSPDMDTDGSPDGRVGFESEGGVRLGKFSIGLFCRGAGFQEPDAKLLQAGGFLSYMF